MIELSKDRILQMLHEETMKKEELPTILRAVYTRYMRLFERYFSDISALNDDVIAELRAYHEETRSLIRYFYMDIPYDLCSGIMTFEREYSDYLLGLDWHKYVFDKYDAFRKTNKGKIKGEDQLRAEFSKQVLNAFYDAMDYIFRDGFGTGSNTANEIVSGIAGLLFGKKE